MTIIFSDVDGTLLTSGHQVSDRTKQAICAAVASGMTFVPVSARMPKAIQPIMDSIGVVSPIISYNGALVQQKSGDVLLSKTMATDLALAILQELKELGLEQEVTWNVYSYQDWYVADKKAYWVARETAIVGVEPDEIDLDGLSKLDGVHKVLLMGDPEVIAPLELTLKERFEDCYISKSYPYFIEIVAEGISKSEAVKHFATLEGASMADTLAFGDNFNDLDMLELVGQPFVMGNAPQEVKERIGQVTSDNDHDGIALVLENYLRKS